MYMKLICVIKNIIKTIKYKNVIKFVKVLKIMKIFINNDNDGDTDTV